jgi:hypothetical protein
MVDLGGCMQIVQVSSRTVKVWTIEGILLTLSDIMHVLDAKSHYFLVIVLLEKKGHIVFEDMGFAIYLAGMHLTSSYCDRWLFWFNASVKATAGLLKFSC